MSTETGHAAREPQADDVSIRECTTIEEFDACVRLQREVFGLLDMEISPRRHLVVSRQAGGWTLGAFQGAELVGFVHHLAAVRGDEIFGYSHMMAVAERQQNRGLGARLKWAQRARALAEGRKFIKWTWDPMRARNAHFNLNRLGVVVRAYAINFYGTDYATTPGAAGKSWASTATAYSPNGTCARHASKPARVGPRRPLWVNRPLLCRFRPTGRRCCVQTARRRDVSCCASAQSFNKHSPPVLFAPASSATRRNQVICFIVNRDT